MSITPRSDDLERVLFVCIIAILLALLVAGIDHLTHMSTAAFVALGATCSLLIGIFAGAVAADLHPRDILPLNTAQRLAPLFVVLGITAIVSAQVLPVSDPLSNILTAVASSVLLAAFGTLGEQRLSHKKRKKRKKRPMQ